MEANTGHRPLLALLIRLGAIAALSTMSALIKLASARGIQLPEIIFWRQFVTIPILLIWVLATSGLATLSTRRPGTHAARALYGLVGMILNFGAVILLPLAEATTINFSVPIFAVILSTLLLKEQVGIWRWSAVACGFAGILLITQPGSGHIPILGAMVALGGAFMIALISIQIADLNRTEKPITIVFWFAAISTPVAAIALPFTYTPHSGFEWLLLLAIGVFGSIGQLLLTAALRFGAVASVIVMDYSALFWATLYGWMLFDMLPPASTWIGAPLIVAAGIVIAWREHLLARRGKRAKIAQQGTQTVHDS
ncbi:drug/metabolite transporter (DMT)-like permease [Altererythrobacter atlanticus]|uniref:Riboflavin transporter n=1 Tax=Croceibacterium atlanticum TaxID=1267766 RepID=A0A0F7KR08_9SPHN|nr:DMT family transporter [Croceibacterium atlanticum]AKH42009.1 Riboflavin transporter [Croceibacterium atlanticum]MBB5733423.1 drug/metabolite transporter (DMT)-like permease [Croceibacterium atlanticum]